MKILVIEDDKRLAATVKRGLEQEGYAVDVALDGTDGQWLATEQHYDAIVLDVMLPGVNGYRLCAGLREAGDWTPILMLTAKRGEYDEAEALDTGADDFLSKPFSFVVLLARLRALVRRGRSERPAVIEIGDLRLDPAAHQCRRGDDGHPAQPTRVLGARVPGPTGGIGGEQARAARARVGLRVRGRRQHRRGVRAAAPAQGRRAVRPDDDPDRAWCGVPGRRVMRSWFATVRVRTTVFATLVVTVALVAGALLLLGVQHRALVAGLERSVRNRSADVADLARRDALPKTLTAAKEDAAFTQVVDTRGTVLGASRNLRGRGVVFDAAPTSAEALLVTRTIGPLDDSRFRVAVRRVNTPSGPVLVFAGDQLEAVDEATDHLILVLGMGLPLLIGLVAITTWGVTGRALRPVEAIRSEVSEIGEGELHRRVPEPSTHDEVGRLARTMNSMLDRLDESADRQRRFVSDASHELQSPLTSLRARLEVNLSARTEPDWRANEEDALLEVTAMQRLVDDLLTLARFDAGVASRERIPVDLDDLVLHEAERLRTRARVTVDVRHVSAGQIEGDPDQLRRAVRNVLDNAERYAAHEVCISVQENDEMIEVDVADDGAGVPEEHREQIFERFSRIDEARARDGASTGLGLAITREIVEAHGGHITVEDGEPGARFVFRFPAVNAS